MAVVVRDASEAATAESALVVLVQIALLNKRDTAKARIIAKEHVKKLRIKHEEVMDQDIDGSQGNLVRTLAKERRAAESAAHIALDAFNKSNEAFRALRLLAKDFTKEAVSKAQHHAPPPSRSRPLCWYCRFNNAEGPVYACGSVTTYTRCRFVCQTCHDYFEMNRNHSFKSL